MALQNKSLKINVGIVKFILISSLTVVFIQDLKDRSVYWFLFPVIGFCCGYLLFDNTVTQHFYLSVSINAVFVFILLLTVFLYSKFKLKASLKETFGLGDRLLFAALIFSFSSVSFIVLFVFGLLFSLVLHLLLKKYSRHETVPLAGYLSLFFGIVYNSHWLGILKSLYII